MKIISILLSILLQFPTILIAQERFRRNPPLPEPLPILNLPRIESTTLSNGLTLSVIRRTNISIITLCLIVFAGESTSPDEMPGLASFAANMMNKGSQNLSSADIEETIESIGGAFSAETFPDYTLFSFSFLDDYLDQALELLKEMLIFPAFIQREIENVKRIMYYDLATKNSNPEFVGKRILCKILFQDHPYQKYVFNSDVIKNFDRSALSDFFDKFYRPRNVQLFLVGNISLSSAAIRVSRYLNTWKGGIRQNVEIDPPKVNEKSKTCFVSVPQAKNTVVFIGNQLPPQTDDVYFPLLVLNQVMGGSHLSRLFMNLREAKGYAYWAYSTLDFFKTCGIFTITARVRPRVIHTSIQESLREIGVLYLQRIPSSEIEQAKATLIGNFPLSLESSEDLCTRFSEIQAFALGRKHWDQYYENIMMTDSQAVYQAVQKTALHNPVIVIAGDSSVLEHLMEFDDVEVYDIKGDYQYSIKGEHP